MPLTDTAVKNAKPAPKKHRLFDQKGLYLQVEPNGSKLWRYKYHFNKKEKTLALGQYPEVTLARAREKHLEARRLLDCAIDPGEHKKQLKRDAELAAASSFQAIALEWFAKFSPPWAESHSSKVKARLENDIFPWLGSRPITAIEPPELLHTLQRVEKRGAIDTAHRCLYECGKVFQYAIASGRAKRNPAADLRGALSPVQHGHFASITNPEEVGPLLRAMDGYRGHFVTRCALRLAPLVITRPIELRSAEWSEFDLPNAVWRIPKEKMKMDNDHIVPLSRQAVEILTELRPLTGRGRYVFPSVKSSVRPMSENTVNGALRRIGYTGDEMCGHGFRAMARTILDEVLEFRVDLIEHQLAHAVKDPNGRAYNRTAFLKQRLEMMQAWANYLDERRKDPVPVVTPLESQAA